MTPEYRRRWIAEKLPGLLRAFPVVVITGARQTGKTTLLQKDPLFQGWAYFSVDDPLTLELLQRSPQEVLGQSQRIILDEIQKWPQGLTHIKQIVDHNPDVRFVLSGSFHLLLSTKISETLAGRAVYLTLHPFALGEWEGFPPPSWFSQLWEGRFPEEGVLTSPDPLPFLFRGFLPRVLLLKDPELIATWWRSYVQTYLERDLRDLSKITHLADFHRVMRMLAHQVGSVLDESRIARDAGVSIPTTHRYLNLLEASLLFLRLPPYTRGGKRYRKRPKTYYLDPGLTAHLLGAHFPEDIPRIGKQGALFENLVLLHLQILASHLGGEIFFLREGGATEREVDFLFLWRGKWLLLEVKYASHISPGHVRNLMHYLERFPEPVIGGIVIYTGQAIRRLGPRLLALPWTALTGEIAGFKASSPLP